MVFDKEIVPKGQVASKFKKIVFLKCRTLNKKLYNCIYT